MSSAKTVITHTPTAKSLRTRPSVRRHRRQHGGGSNGGAGGVGSTPTVVKPAASSASVDTTTTTVDATPTASATTTTASASASASASATATATATVSAAPSETVTVFPKPYFGQKPSFPPSAGLRWLPADRYTVRKGVPFVGEAAILCNNCNRWWLQKITLGMPRIYCSCGSTNLERTHFAIVKT